MNAKGVVTTRTIFGDLSMKVKWNKMAKKAKMKVHRYNHLLSI